MAIGIRILSNNLSGLTTNVTFLPQSGGTISLGTQVFPFNYISEYVYGTYNCYVPTYGYTYTLDVLGPTPTPTPTNTTTPTNTPTQTTTNTSTPTNTPTQTQTNTPTQTTTPTQTSTPTQTPTNTGTPTQTPTNTTTTTPTNTGTPTQTPTPTQIFVTYLIAPCLGGPGLTVEFNSASLPVVGGNYYLTFIGATSEGCYEIADIAEPGTGSDYVSSFSIDYGNCSTCLSAVTTPTPTPTNTATNTPTPTHARFTFTVYSGTTYDEACGQYNPSVTIYGDKALFDENTIFYNVLSGPTTVDMTGYYNSSQTVVQLDSNGNETGGFSICATLTPTPTNTSTPTPTPTSGIINDGWLFYLLDNVPATVPPSNNGNTVFVNNATVTYNPNYTGGTLELYFNNNTTSGTSYLTQFTELGTSGGTITISQGSNVVIYSGTSGEYSPGVTFSNLFVRSSEQMIQSASTPFVSGTTINVVKS